MKTEYLGLWKTRTAWYRSQVLSKEQIQNLPPKTRILLRENNRHQNNDDGTPRFIFSFADEQTADSISFEIEEYSDVVDIVLYLKEQLIDIRGKAMRGQDASDNYDTAYHKHCDIEEICDNCIDKIANWQSK